MTETAAPYTTDADLIRDALDTYGALTRVELADKTNLERSVLAKSLYALKKQGDVIEEGDRLTLTKATETAQDAPEEAETGIGSTPAVESGTGQDEGIPDPPTFCGLASDDRIQDAVQKMLETIPRQDTRPKSPDELPELATSSLDALIADYRRVIDEWRLMKLQADDSNGLRADNEKLRKDNEKLRETLSSRDEAWNALAAEAVAYRKLKKQLQGMIDD